MPFATFLSWKTNLSTQTGSHCPAGIPFLMRTSHALGEGQTDTARAFLRMWPQGWGTGEKGGPTHGLGCLYCSSQAPTPIFPDRGLGKWDWFQSLSVLSVCQSVNLGPSPPLSLSLHLTAKGRCKPWVQSQRGGPSSQHPAAERKLLEPGSSQQSPQLF